MASTPFLQELRNRTAASHQALENNALSVNLMSAQVTTLDHALYLQRLYGFVSAFEARVFSMPGLVLPDIEQRRKSAVMEKDLGTMGVDAGRAPVVAPDFFAELYRNNAQAMGGMYVMEGSTLGGVMINKHLQKTLGNAMSSHYFDIYGAHTGGMWKQFLSALIETADRADVQEEMIVAAERTFSALEQWLNNAPLQPTIRY